VTCQHDADGAVTVSCSSLVHVLDFRPAYPMLMVPQPCPALRWCVMSTFLSPRHITLHLIVPLTCVSSCIYSHLLAYVPDPHLTISLSHRLTSAHRITTVQHAILIGRHSKNQCSPLPYTAAHTLHPCCTFLHDTCDLPNSHFWHEYSSWRTFNLIYYEGGLQSESAIQLNFMMPVQGGGVAQLC
jgi:hypothetical protein